MDTTLYTRTINTLITAIESATVPSAPTYRSHLTAPGPGSCRKTGAAKRPAELFCAQDHTPACGLLNRTGFGDLHHWTFDNS